MLIIKDLYKTYGTVKALNGMSFHVNPGEMFGFVGSNGAGKTTAMRIILGVLSSDSGEVTWQDNPIDFAMRKEVGYMPEERGLYPRMKVGEQLIFLSQLHGDSFEKAKHDMEYWTEKLDIAHRRDDLVQTLSLGNQQRVQLAAALVSEPQLMVLDEPFSGLDPVAVDVMSEVLREKTREGVPVIFSSHQLDLVERLCDRVGIVSKGRIVSEGTIDDLRRTENPEYILVTPADSEARFDHLGVSTPSQVINENTMTRHLVGPPGFDGQQILRAALEFGPVYEFSPRKPHLEELFRDVVSTSSDRKDQQ
ncbi:ABC transporter ATP-binding protein [Flaviflexus massiliensis]|uniref:ABC transporter ATP-binding protein n=1 Tax=Flaviflexus massiliensis TaxID=1522309 RepID=UPI0006D5B3AC|nr:ATP-binding cassette domain-containing protein [Flaviflexus massiliensis]